MDGPNLRGLIGSQPDGRCDLATTLRIGSQMCQALEFAHSHGILHRDIKSENIMLTSDGMPKLMDLGLAYLGGGPKVTQAGMMVGAVAYMRPELELRGFEPLTSSVQRRRSPAELQPRSHYSNNRPPVTIGNSNGATPVRGNRPKSPSWRIHQGGDGYPVLSLLSAQLSARTGLRRVPIPGTSTSTTSPS